MVASDHDIPFDYLPEYQELLDECRTMLEDLPSEEIDELVKEFNINQ
jgi:hypothetical protein